MKYNVTGHIDSAATYAGSSANAAIEGLEIRIFEESSLYTTRTATGTRILTAPYINQVLLYPTGCESISAVMALNAAGYDITPEDFIDNYLEKGDRLIFDPTVCFGGSPYERIGMGCYAPVIERAMNKYLKARGSKHKAVANYGKPIEELCAEYIDNGIPVVFWATIDMGPTWISREMNVDNKLVQWIAPEHCLLLIGYTDTHYVFHDPWRQENSYYAKDSVAIAYITLGMQSVVLSSL